VIVVCLACRTRVAMACKSSGRLVMASVCRSGSTRRTKDAPPGVKQRAQEGGQPATSKVRRDQAAPARLALQRVENILGARRDRDPAGQTSRDFLAGLRGKAASKPEPSGTGADLASPC
jgi:hypothetical protein